MQKAMVGCFTATSTTLKVAQEISKALQIELFKLEPVKPYTRADLDWTNPTSRTSKEQKDATCEVAIKALPNLQEVKLLFLGFPIWWYQEPKIIDSFLQKVNLDGKIIVPFATSGGSGIVKAQLEIQKRASNAQVKYGQCLNSEDVASWAKSVMDRLA